MSVLALILEKLPMDETKVQCCKKALKKPKNSTMRSTVCLLSFSFECLPLLINVKMEQFGDCMAALFVGMGGFRGRLHWAQCNHLKALFNLLIVSPTHFFNLKFKLIPFNFLNYV